MLTNIADLHCDLLVYLNGDDARTAYDPCCRCAISQLQTGNVKLQILPAYVPVGPKSSIEGMEQARIFEKLPQIYPEIFEIIRTKPQISSESNRIKTIFAFENAAGFCSDEESLELAWERLEDLERKSIKVAYISMTWNEENRFGGGALTSVGLKADGEKLLQFLHKRKTAIDFSHTSDALAEGILNYITKKNLDIPILASHSNFRSVKDVPRNLPDEIAKEILRRKGIIGLNFVKAFVGEDPDEYFVKHLEYGLGLGAEDQLCIGADFFYVDDIPLDKRKKADEYFFSSYGNASCYPNVIDLWKQSPLASEDLLNKITHTNLNQFLQTQIYT
jgi:membrane dipeptidase